LSASGIRDYLASAVRYTSTNKVVDLRQGLRQLTRRRVRVVVFLTSDVVLRVDEMECIGIIRSMDWIVCSYRRYWIV
jgi:hypothetical protein